MGEVNRYEIPAEIPGPDAPPKAGAGEQKSEERPAYVPEKFWKDGKVDLEGMSKSYSELEKRNSSLKPAPPADSKPADGKSLEKPADQPAGETQAIPGVSAEDSKSFSEELAKGGLSEDSYGKLAKAGYPKAVVDAYIQGIKSEQSTQLAEAAEIKKIAGGDDGYAAMTGWMVANLSPEEVADYNAVVSSQNRAMIRLAVKDMHSRYSEATGTAPNLLGGKGNNPNVGDVFESRAQVTEAMKDKRYRTDEAYRKRVAEKLGRSKI